MRSLLVTLSFVLALGLGVVGYSALAQEDPGIGSPVATAASTPAEAAVVPASFPEAMAERTLGSVDAPLVMDEYFSLTCPHCGHFHTTILPQLKKDYIDTGKLRIVYHDFIFDEIGLKAAMVTRCVSPTAYGELVGTLFQMQQSWTNPQSGENVLKQVAGFAGLSPAAYEACVGNKELSDWILQGRVDALNSLNINSTPTFLFRGNLERIVGAQDYSEFKAAIDRQLARLAPAPAAAATQP